MNKKGFTLTELLATIALLAIISLISLYSIGRVRNNIDKNLLKDKIDNIEAAAVYYGEDNRSSFTTGCSVSDKCIATDESDNGAVTVKFLLDNNWLESDTKDDNDNSVFINDVTKENMSEDKVFIYIKNNRIYASMDCDNFISNNNECPE